MRTKMNRVVISDVLFVGLLLASGMTAGLTSDLLYASAFLLPIALGIFFLSREKREPEILLLPLKKEERSKLLLVLPLAAPTLLLIVLCAWLTSFLLGLAGKTDTTDLTGILWRDLLVSAMIPAIAEEILFRYLPLRLMEGEDRRQVLFFSAFFFALIHCNLFRLPYAFVAGLLFAFADLLAGSVLPSILLHFVNNAVSVIWINKNDTRSLPIYLCVLGVITLISIPVFLQLKERYISEIRRIFDKKSKLYFSLSAISLTIILLYLILSSFIYQ